MGSAVRTASSKVAGFRARRRRLSLGVAAICVGALLLAGCDTSKVTNPGALPPSSTVGPDPADSSDVPAASSDTSSGAVTFKPLAFKGRGDKLVKFKIPEDAAAVAVLTHAGSSNFVVTSVDGSGGMNDLLVNEIGRYKGTRLFDADQHSAALKIEADGAWTLAIKPITQARAWNLSASASGTGDDVLRITGSVDGLAASTIRHSGQSNFVVTAYSASGRDLLVNEIGKYSGEVQIPSGLVLLEVEADGKWSISVPN